MEMTQELNNCSVIDNTNVDDIMNKLILKLATKNANTIENDYNNLIRSRLLWSKLYFICNFLEAFAVCLSLIMLNLKKYFIAIVFMSILLGIQKMISHASKEENNISHRLSSYNSDLGIKMKFKNMTYGDVEQATLKKQNDQINI